MDRAPQERERDAQEDDIAVIHLRVPRALKGDWIRRSRYAQMRLAEWVVNHVVAGIAREEKEK
jgi:hypothetical protein